MYGTSAKKLKVGSPADLEKESAFLKAVENLEANDVEQTTVNDIITKMAELLGPDCELYTFKHTKKKNASETLW